MQVSKDENRRLRERIDAAERSAKSREKIEDSFRRKAESLDKKCKVPEACRLHPCCLHMYVCLYAGMTCAGMPCFPKNLAKSAAHLMGRTCVWRLLDLSNNLFECLRCARHDEHRGL
jgi:hypothetical protein